MPADQLLERTLVLLSEVLLGEALFVVQDALEVFGEDNLIELERGQEQAPRLRMP